MSTTVNVKPTDVKRAGRQQQPRQRKKNFTSLKRDILCLGRTYEQRFDRRGLQAIEDFVASIATKLGIRIGRLHRIRKAVASRRRGPKRAQPRALSASVVHAAVLLEFGRHNRIFAGDASTYARDAIGRFMASRAPHHKPAS